MSQQRTTPKRPVDKDLIWIQKNTVGNSQVTTVLRTSEMAETFTGGVISNIVRVIAATEVESRGACAIILLRDGQTISTLTLTDAGKLYSPEQDVLWATPWAFQLPATDLFLGYFTNISERIKTKRKMKKGDQLVYLAIGDVASAVDLTALFTGFYLQ